MIKAEDKRTLDTYPRIMYALYIIAELIHHEGR